MRQVNGAVSRRTAFRSASKTFLAVTVEQCMIETLGASVRSSVDVGCCSSESVEC